MKIDQSYTLTSDPTAVYSLATSQSFREEVCEAQGSPEAQIEIDEADGNTTITIVRTIKGSIPASMSKFVGNDVTVKQVESWAAADHNGNRTADLRITVVGQPADMTGAISLDGSEQGTVTFRVAGEMKVNVPFFGKKIEPEIAKILTQSLDVEIDMYKGKL